MHLLKSCKIACFEMKKKSKMSNFQKKCDAIIPYSLLLLQHHHDPTPYYNLGFICTFFSTDSTRVAFIISPLTFSLPDMNIFCAFALPVTSFSKSSSFIVSVMSASFPSGPADPFPTVPVFLRSMYHVSCVPALFLRVKAKMALACLMASLRSASDERERAISSKAAEEGSASVMVVRGMMR